MNNYQICAQWVLDQEHGKSPRVLDYGCGAGEIIKELRHNNIDASGCDIFYEGGDYSGSIDPALLDNKIIKKIENDTIPFESNSFDFVINNQVMEHVEDINIVLAEIQRVLKPGGKVLSLFPDNGIWRECHSGIPFLHWFPKGSQFRVYYAAAFRSLGFGHFKGDKTIMQWSRDFCDWLDQWTYYRSIKDIELSYSTYFSDIQHIEEYWLQKKLGGQGKNIASIVPVTAQQLFVHKFAGLVFVSSK